MPCWFTNVVSIIQYGQRQFEDWRKAAELKEIVTDIDDSASVTVGRKRPAFSSLKATSLSIALASKCYPKHLHGRSAVLGRIFSLFDHRELQVLISSFIQIR
jgi:hypothetical protein